MWGWWKTSRQIKYGVLSWSSNYRKQCHKTCELAFADAVRLYNHWRVEPPNVPAPTLGFRTLKVSLSGICDLVTAYKNEPLPLAVHDQLWTLIVDMKLKAELAIDPPMPRARDVSRCLFKIAARHLIAERLMRHGRVCRNIQAFASPLIASKTGAMSSACRIGGGHKRPRHTDLSLINTFER